MLVASLQLRLHLFPTCLPLSMLQLLFMLQSVKPHRAQLRLGSRWEVHATSKNTVMVPQAGASGMPVVTEGVPLWTCLDPKAKLSETNEDLAWCVSF